MEYEDIEEFVFYFFPQNLLTTFNSNIPFPFLIILTNL